MKRVLWPIIGALLLISGILIGNILAVASYRIDKKVPITKDESKLTKLINMIDAVYVDTISTDSITEEIIPDIISKLDPHSMYIPAKDVESVNEELEGSFSGIGVQFNIQNDTIYVVDVITNGPAEKAGMMPGDRIISVNDSIFVGKDITTQKVFKKLRGKKGSKVKLGVVRRTSKEVLIFEITRDDVPVNSVDVAYIVRDDIGLISVNKFGVTTYEEFRTAAASLIHQGAKKLIVDLRGNSGGYLDAAVNMVNEFLEKDKLIVYVQGKAQHYTESTSNGYGSFKGIKLAVLIDEFSGSASEIFAGAIQDNDRGIIVGRRSFGKGLVQRQFPLGDGSEVRLTVARYYTPSGRCIQKPYKMGDANDYMEDIANRFMHGEFFSADSIHFPDSLKYTTVGGRTVYGGGGIMPDIFVPRDTTGMTSYYYEMINKGCIYQFALKYTDEHRAELKKYDDWRSMSQYLKSKNLYSQLIAFGKEKNINAKGNDAYTSKHLIENLLYAYIVRNILGDKEFFPMFNNEDPTVLKAVELLDEDSFSL